LAVVQKALRERAVDFLSNAPVPSIDHIIDLCRVGESDVRSVAEHVIEFRDVGRSAPTLR
jgi:hypothetical protein